MLTCLISKWIKEINSLKKVFPIVQVACDLFASHITTEESRLNVTTEDEDAQDQIDEFIDNTMVWSHIESALPSYFCNGSMFIRFMVTPNGKICMEAVNTKWCYPVFDENDELESVLIRFVYKNRRI